MYYNEVLVMEMRESASSVGVQVCTTNYNANQRCQIVVLQLPVICTAVQLCLDIVKNKNVKTRKLNCI